jgi:hypothetical protein
MATPFGPHGPCVAFVHPTMRLPGPNPLGATPIVSMGAKLRSDMPSPPIGHAFPPDRTCLPPRSDVPSPPIGQPSLAICIERFVGAGTRSPVRAGHRRNASERSPERRAETAECATPSSYGDFAAGAQGDGTNAASDFCSWWPRARGETWTESGRARVVAARKQATEDDGRTTPCSATTWSARRRTELTMTPSEERARRGWRVERGCRRNAGNG